MDELASAAAQDYLKAMYMLQGEDGTVSTNALAQRLGVSAASATKMLKRLAAMGLVTHVPYRGAELTEGGRKIALEVIRHHRLLETYLAEVMGVPWDEVHAEAEVLEHVLSESLEDRMAALLGHPEADPHGHPIPAKDGAMPARSLRSLWDATESEQVTVERVSDDEAEALRYLADIAVVPGAVVEVLGRGPKGGPLFVKVADGDRQALSKDLAETVWVQ
ncbi:MAG: metal-dependent transcriptional regulator [Actinomycetota bacterium]|nr:metal-dependent transcriptional regulator [Actinomycetota bacterium]